jgi:hypothetical protein
MKALVLLLLVLATHMPGFAQTPPPAVQRLIADHNIKIAWVSSDAESDSLRLLENNRQAFDIVVLASVRPHAPAVSAILRGWLERGGIIWTFDRGTFNFYSTWRNKELFGGLIAGAEVGSEDPEKAEVWIQDMRASACDPMSVLADSVKEVILGDERTTRRDSTSGQIDAAAKTFDYLLQSDVVPVICAQSLGPAYVNADRTYVYANLAGNMSRRMGPANPSAERVVLGFAKRIGIGMVVVLPAINIDSGSGAQFLMNVAKWSVSQSRK